MTEETQAEVTQEREEAPEAQEQQAEETQEPSLADIQAKLEETTTALQSQEERYKDLSARLTREQQEKAELYRFHKQTLPKINKTFTEQWEVDPEQAVDHVVKEQVQPVDQKLAIIEARQAETDLLVRNPHLAKYQEKVRSDLGNKHWQLTQTPDGIESLYRMAEAEDLRAENAKLKSNGQAEAEKARAYTEGSSPKQPPPKPKRKLSPAEKNVALNLGISEEQYIKQLEV